MPQLHPRDACVIVTGGESGIGAAMARRSAADGAHVVVDCVNAEPGPGAGALTATSGTSRGRWIRSARFSS